MVLSVISAKRFAIQTIMEHFVEVSVIVNQMKRKLSYN